jgi:type II secretory pathway pseudopilin PulG
MPVGANERLKMRLEDERGINMVDLMMWLVIAALLLAAALQGIGFYQRAAWSYQLKNDASNVRTYLEGYRAQNGSYPNWDGQGVGAVGMVTLTGSNYISGYAIDGVTGDWAFRVCSPSLKAATGDKPGSGLRVSRSDQNVFGAVECSQF